MANRRKWRLDDSIENPYYACDNEPSHITLAEMVRLGRATLTTAALRGRTTPEYLMEFDREYFSDGYGVGGGIDRIVCVPIRKQDYEKLKEQGVRER